MRHIHAYIVSWHLSTRGNNKILRTAPTHINSSEGTLFRLTHRTIAQLRTNKSPFLKSYFHKLNAKSHTPPLCPLGNTHTRNTHYLFNCFHIRTMLSPLDLWADPVGVTLLPGRWTKSWLVDHKGEDRTPPSKGQGSGLTNTGNEYTYYTGTQMRP